MKFSLKRTPALIKRDILCLFSSKARTEKRADEDQQRARLEMKPCAEVLAVSTTPAREQVPQTPVRSPIAPTASPKTIEPWSASKDTTNTATFDSGSSPITPPSTATTGYSTSLPTTYGAAMAFFDYWYKQQHPNISIPESERNLFRGVIITLAIALLNCFEEPIYSSLIGFRPEEVRVPYSRRALEQILASLTDDRIDAQRLAENLLSVTGPDLLGSLSPREFMTRIGYAKTRITDHESYALHDGFHRLLSEDRQLC
ncbi:uncharacterized protein N0V89_002938 [Didymosphaeria variabile]|uniref:Uncharacterized protein n=1 Tax=Didymosphaeria variabile TaxID=1932322 RepID=A0A9W9CE33_9PLEO|nr:uncharacterized protein N0V89_002938 [Didymosphaeria variabile]KAJ4358356.1 hypothetical protein N0V89_002938 [Didymosphaeria variabile]